MAILETHVLLDYLWELAGKDSSALASLGFPRHCSFLLEKQLATCEEKQIMPLPDYVPLGWTGAVSKGDEGDLPGILIIVFDGPPGTGKTYAFKVTAAKSWRIAYSLNVTKLKQNMCEAAMTLPVAELHRQTAGLVSVHR